MATFLTVDPLHFFLDEKTKQKNQDFLKNHKKILQNPPPQIKRTPLSGSDSFLSQAHRCFFDFQ